MLVNKRAKQVMARLIQEARQAHGLSQRALALRLSMPQGTVSAWETAKAFPDGINLIYLELALQLEEGELVKRWKGEMVKRGWLPPFVIGSLGTLWLGLGLLAYPALALGEPSGQPSAQGREAVCQIDTLPLIGRWRRRVARWLGGFAPGLAFA